VHILQLTDFYHPVIGGLERHVATLSKEFIRLGHSVAVVTLQSGDLPDEETVDGVRVIRIRGWSQQLTHLYADAAHPFHPTAPDPGAVAALRRVVKREQPAVVHSHSWLQYSYFPLYRRHQGPAHVVTLHDYGLACARKTLQLAGHAGQCPGPRLTRCLQCAPEQYGVLKGTAITAGLRASRALHQRADRYIAISTAVAEGSRAALPAHAEVTVLPTMVPNDMADLARATLRPGFLPRDDGYLMFVGALGPHKGLDVLLDARRRMRHRPPLVLIGTPRPDTPAIEDPGIVTARNVPSAQVMASWLHASIAIVPSVWQEPLGQVAMEAMLVGRPVVASDVGGLRDVVEHGSTGLMVPPGDPGALAAALDGLLDNPELQRRMGDAGRIRARQFEAAAVAPQIIQVFDSALLSRNSSPSRANILSRI
jgi:glycosyltransferase involved in cell wall biosynthesis